VRAWTLLACALALFLARSAAAAPATLAQERSVSEGVDRPIKDYSGEGDSTSMELNPAMLTTIRGLDIGLLGYQTISALSRGSGFGAFLAANLRLGFAFGFGAQFMQPGLGDGMQDFARDRNPSATKLTWAMAGGLGERGSFGIAIHGIRAESQWLRRPDLDIGLHYRIRNYGSLGVVAKLSPGDLRDDDYPSVASMIAELALRPLGTRVFELAGGLNAVLATAQPGEGLAQPGGARGLHWRGRVALRWEGVALLGQVEQVPATELDPVALTPLRVAKGLRGSVAVELGWDWVRGRVGLIAGLNGGVDGIGGEAHLSTMRHGRVYWPRRVDAERIDLGELDDERSLVAMLQRIERARVAGERSILVIQGDTKAGWATLHEVREALVRARDAGAHVYAWLEDGDMRNYYVATVAEKIYVHPAGSLQTMGIAATQFYFTGLLDKLGVKAEVVKIGEYKSANEAFTETGPSEPEREQETAILKSTYATIVGDVARGRGLSRDEVRAAFDDAPHDPDDAVAKKLVDEIAYRDQLLDRISEELGADVDFAKFPETAHEQPTWSTPPYVAVVLVEGTIIDGKSRFIPILNLHFSGGDTIADTIAELRSDPLCRGIVLRVNSPGGSALASDVIWREVERTAVAHAKEPRFEPPIVVSMGDVAASGGYYVAMGTRPVLADPMTITGSIGVISLHVDLSGLLAKLGISTATFKEGANADMSQPWRPFTADQRARVEKAIQSTYDLFRSRVAKGRGITTERVHELGRGHVYTGADAKKVGLVDQLGGLDDAIAQVREKAGVRKRTHLEVRVLPERIRLLDIVLQALGLPNRTDRNASLRGRARKRDRAPSFELPQTIDLALAKLPLSLVFLKPGKSHALMTWSGR
jgi:protease IV